MWQSGNAAMGNCRPGNVSEHCTTLFARQVGGQGSEQPSSDTNESVLSLITNASVARTVRVLRQQGHKTRDYLEMRYFN